MSDDQLIKENGNLILNQDKYFYLIVSGNKVAILSQGRSKSEVKKDAIATIIKKTKDLSSFNDKTIYFMTIRKVTAEEKQEEKDSKGISLVGGPIVVVIEDIKVKVASNNKIKFENLGEVGNSKVFLNNKYLKKYNNIDNSHIKKIAYAYNKNITNNATAVNTITNILKKV
jgi:uncharacterized Zn ribbon protein